LSKKILLIMRAEAKPMKSSDPPIKIERENIDTELIFMELNK